jgi:hypothetical protein
MTFKVIDRRTLNEAIAEEEREEQERLEKENEDPKKRMMREDGIVEELTPLEERRITLPKEARLRHHDQGYEDGIQKIPVRSNDPDYLAGWLEGFKRAQKVGSGSPIIVPPKFP